MPNIVIDTNVVISAALTPHGNPAKIMKAVYEKEELQLYYSLGILDEYEGVISRPYLKLPFADRATIIDRIKKIGILIDPNPSEIPLPDESDRIFYDTAKTAGAILVTGNIKHFPTEIFILSPQEFLEKFGI